MHNVMGIWWVLMGAALVVIVVAVAAYLVAWHDARILMGKARFLEVPQYDPRNWQRLDHPKSEKVFFAS